MASAVIHICVANEINKVLKRNEKDIILGSIAPDISKQVGEPKLKSHFMDKDNAIPDVKKFVKKYPNFYKNDFELGYYIHIYTDLFWNYYIKEIILDDLVKMKDGSIVKITKEELKDILYNDYTNLNIKVIDKYDLPLNLFYEEVEIPESNIDEIPLDKIQVIVDQMGIIILNSKTDKEMIIDIKDINKFIELSTIKILDTLKNYS